MLGKEETKRPALRTTEPYPNYYPFSPSTITAGNQKTTAIINGFSSSVFNDIDQYDFIYWFCTTTRKCNLATYPLPRLSTIHALQRFLQRTGKASTATTIGQCPLITLKE